MGTLAKKPQKNMKNNAKNEKCVYWNDGFFRVNFQHVLKMVVKTVFLCKNNAKNTLKMKSVDTEMNFFFKVNFQPF